MKLNRKKIFNIVKILALVYGIVGIALYYLQDRFLFQPTGIKGNKYNLSMQHDMVKIPLSKADTIAIIKFPAATENKKGLLIYFHGNKINVEHYASYAAAFNKAGYDVWMPDYPGFGLSTGEITEQGLMDLGYQVRKMADNNYTPDSIIVYGKSLGSAIASYVAANSENKMLILESTYYNMAEVMSDFAPIYPVSSMSQYDFPVHKYLEDVSEPVIIFQGDADWITRHSNAAELRTVLKDNDRFITIEGGSHNDLADFPLYKTTIDSLLNYNSSSITLAADTLK